ncbi:hypothetical protein AJ80_06304 [Polytolypa hystricis UAMH7299]|uniref:Uncharacterized protein n=1 Tax=Polytolypa hystricis (strain UAMH7299) TaxID=1447883 RepID=A0A2B7XWV7_POLH7|nr:hypothetical protein AJ80_06304 [Polytolypa hystricis UAMH7299]
MTVFDEIAETNGDNEWKAWLEKVLDSKVEIAKFPASRRKGGNQAKEIVGYLKRSFNFGIRITFGDPGPDTFMKYLSQNTTIPLPRVIDWDLTAESPQQLGPFIIMDYVDGTCLATVLKQPTQDDEEGMILNPTIDDAKLDKVYGQIINFMLQLSQLGFSCIGSISEDPVSNTWSVTDIQHERRNLADDPEDAQKRFVARHRFKQLIPNYCISDTGPFKPFCDDLQPSNMLVDKETLEITAVFDIEFTNITPAQFAYDPPWKFSQPSTNPEWSSSCESWNEEESGCCGPCLSVLMRDSWSTGRFWFDYAARKSFDVNAVYWAALHDDSASVELLGDEARAEMEPFIQMKMEQLKAYKEECAARFF